jgi:ABC-2 type transport system ATP-binding protein
MKPADHVIVVDDLVKEFQVPERDAGLRSAFGSLFRRQVRTVRAVNGVSFSVAGGEMVGFLGPNGAGKTTMLKLLAGILQPTRGHVSVLGCVPGRRAHSYLRQISLLMGNRNQLQWDLPAADSFELNRAIYRVGKVEFRRNRDELVELLDIGDLVRRPVRLLSLGERMRVEIAGALVHQPAVLFLDEPTLGLDITMQKRIRTFLREYNARRAATLLLTSHYMADIESLCERVVLIDDGRIVADGLLADLVDKVVTHKEISVTLADGHGDVSDFSDFGHFVGRDGARVRLRVAKTDTAVVTAKLIASDLVTDLTISDPPVEDAIEAILAGGVSP